MLGLYYTLLAIGGAVTALGLGHLATIWRRGASMRGWVAGIILDGFGALLLLLLAYIYLPERSGMQSSSNNLSAPTSSVPKTNSSTDP